MTFYFGALTALCAAYWILLLVYSGFLVQQHWIWLFFTAFFLLNAAAAWGYRRSLRMTPLWLVTALHTTAFAGMAVMIASGILIATGMSQEEVRNPEFCIVLGASVKEDGSLSPSLKRRLDETIRFSDRNPGTRFVLSGGKGPKEPVTEAEAMGAYLVYNGVPEDRLLLETDSPFLAPVPLRGRANEPAFLVHTLHALAAFRKVTPEHLAAVTAANAERTLPC